MEANEKETNEKQNLEIAYQALREAYRVAIGLFDEHKDYILKNVPTIKTEYDYINNLYTHMNEVKSECMKEGGDYWRTLREFYFSTLKGVLEYADKVDKD